MVAGKHEPRPAGVTRVSASLATARSRLPIHGSDPSAKPTHIISRRTSHDGLFLAASYFDFRSATSKAMAATAKTPAMIRLTSTAGCHLTSSPRMT